MLASTFTEEEYIIRTIGRINAKYKEVKCHIVYLDSPQKIDEYIKTHPKKSKIGFLVKGFFPEFPRYSNPDRPHYSPVYFERGKNQEKYFVQLDSAVPVPSRFILSSRSETPEKLYYSPFFRQVEMDGCMEDGVKMLSHCFKEKNLIEFCKNNSEGHKEEKSETPVENIFKLKSLPAAFLCQIENYETLRHFRLNEPGKFDKIYKGKETVGQRILRQGEKRVSDNPKHEGDIKGKNFRRLKAEYQIKARHPEWKKIEVVKKLDDEEKLEIENFRNLKKENIFLCSGGADIFIHSLPISWFDLRKFHCPDIGNPIHLFAKKGSLDWKVFGYINDISGHIKNFVSRGVDINALDAEGSTVLTSLFCRAEKTNLDHFDTAGFIEELIKQKANPHIKDRWGKSALDYAREKKCRKHIIKLLEECPQPLPSHLLEEKNHEPELSTETDCKKRFAGVCLVAGGVLTLAASTLLLAVTCGAAAPALLVSISLVVSMTGIAGGFVGVPLLERLGNKDYFNARMAAGSVLAGAGVGATTVISPVSQAMGMSASNVAQATGLLGSTATTTAAGSAAFISTMLGIGAGMFAAFVLVAEGLRLIRDSSRVSQNSSALFGHRPRHKKIILLPDDANGPNYRRLTLTGSVNR
ncbi:MAG TPA: hypothetical protein VLJ15_02480 [Gammaproteobacteria bacterium]|nr:hypothetical protein [Gammaproteobacteria bacterium]